MTCESVERNDTMVQLNISDDQTLGITGGLRPTQCQDDPSLDCWRYGE